VKKVRYWLEWLFISGFARLIPLIPFGLLRMLADFAGWVFYLADRRSRAVALANLEAVFGSEMSPERRREVARKSLQVFARSFLELFWTPRLNQKDLEKFISFENPDAFAAILAGACPTIGITPHFGNFEWGSALFAFSGFDGYILTQRFKNDRLTPIFQRIRERPGHRVVTQERSMLRFIKTLRRGKHVGILIDLTLKMNDPGTIISTFGLRMRTTMIHALLHQQTGARLLPFITLARPDGGYSVRILPLLRFPANTPYHEIVQTCWDGFEPIIRQYPEKWLWVYKHWRYLPSTSDRSYPFYANRSERFDQELESQREKE
jgi:Kdo2-lipid IVA lauroyltransferase/acyltransferase